MLRMEKPADRSEIPYFPQIMTWAGTCSGISQKDMMESVDKISKPWILHLKKSESRML